MAHAAVSTAAQGACSTSAACPAALLHHHRARPQCRRAARLVVHSSSIRVGSIAARPSGQQQFVAMDPTRQVTAVQAQQQHQGLGWALPWAGVAGAALLLAAVWKKMSSRSGEAQYFGRQGADSFTTEMMKNVNTVKMEALSDEQIQAARARRSKERANHKITLDDIELPDNHPWATKNASKGSDEATIRARLRAEGRRSRLPPQQDMGGNNGGGVYRGDEQQARRAPRAPAPARRFEPQAPQQ